MNPHSQIKSACLYMSYGHLSMQTTMVRYHLVCWPNVTLLLMITFVVIFGIWTCVSVDEKVQMIKNTGKP